MNLRNVYQLGSGALLTICGIVWMTTGGAAQSTEVSFSKLQLTDKFFCEGAYYGDFNRDQHLDVVSGPFWYPGPAFDHPVQIHEPIAYDPLGYSENFLTYVGDFNGDQWDDVLYVPWPGKDGFWYENPQSPDGTWRQHRALINVGNESPAWVDLDSDQRPELIYNIDGQLGYATWDPQQPDALWRFQPISDQRSTYQRYTHGLGVGDLDGDGKLDVIEAAGWWRQPETIRETPWQWQEYRFAEAGAQMLVTDVNGDGRQDVITSWHCHLYGLVWHEQIRGEDGSIKFKMHEIQSPNPDLNSDALRISQMHALTLTDVNQDGLMDFVTGKRFWAHGPTGDAEPGAPAVLYWFELQRSSEGVAKFIPHRIDDDSGVGTQVTAVDLNRDQRPDMIVGNKKGSFLFLSK